MLFRFYFQFIVGLVSIVSILYFGELGVKTLAIFALLPIVLRIKGYQKPDERELLIFYKIGNFTMIGTIVVLLLIHHFFDTTVNQNIIGDNWLWLSTASIIFIQGVVGLVIFRIES